MERESEAMTTGNIWRSPDGAMELRCGRWQDVLGDVTTCDAVITDPPYSERTHAGQRSGSRPLGGGGRKTKIEYKPQNDHDELSSSWYKRVTWWAVVFSDHSGSHSSEAAWEQCGWYVFAPVGYVRTNPTPRLSGDGPTSAIEYITVARKKERLPSDRAGSRPGYYLVKDSNHGSPQQGGKVLTTMRSIIRDYSKPGDLIVDPYAGGGTTLLAAAIEGRRAIGAECDPETYRKAIARLSAGYTPRML